MAEPTILQRTIDLISPTRVFGEPIVRGGTTVVPAVTIRGLGGGGEGRKPSADEGGGGGFVVRARPAGGLRISDDDVRWVVPFDVNRAVLGALVVAGLFVVLRRLDRRRGSTDDDR